MEGCSNQDQLWLGLEGCQNAGRKQNNALQQSTDNELICASSDKRNLISSMRKGTFADCSHLCLECNKRARKRTSRNRSQKKFSLCNPFQNLRFKSRSMRRKTSRYDFCLNWKVLLRRRCRFQMTKTQITLTICLMPLRNSYENPGGMKKPHARKRKASRGHNLSLEWHLSV